ncbi:MLO-like protein 6 [Tanacetum coccineum]
MMQPRTMGLGNKHFEDLKLLDKLVFSGLADIHDRQTGSGHVCFFRQFVRSVPKLDYLASQHGFIVAHLAATAHSRFDYFNTSRDHLKKISRWLWESGACNHGNSSSAPEPVQGVKPTGYLGDISVTATYTLTSKTKLRLNLEAVLENKRTLHRLLYLNPPIKSTEVSNERALNTWFEVSRY